MSSEKALVFNIFTLPSALEKIYAKADPRWIIAIILGSYNILGFTVLGFNRSPMQMVVTSIMACLLELLLCYWVQRKWVFPLSALITSFSLSLLLNYSHSYWILTVPVFFAIGSKYFLSLNGRHFFNPALTGVVFCLLFSSKFITAAPAYQWTGIENLWVFMTFLGVFFLLPKINRHWLVISFLATFTAQTALRALIMRHHLPFETLFLGTLTSPSFILFTFFMITDPMTSPKTKKDQIIVGASIALLDLIFHIFQSYYTFFFAGFTVASIRFLWFHYKAFRDGGGLAGFKKRLVEYKYSRKFTGSLVAAALVFGTYSVASSPAHLSKVLNWKFDPIPESQSGLHSEFGNIFERVDPRIQHIVKWVFSVGDSVAIGDFDNDGKMDVFLTNMLKKDSERAALYHNEGGFRFSRVALPEITTRFTHVEDNGIPTNALFVDYDNDNDLDLFISVAFGSSRLLKNMLTETGKAEFVDVTAEVGLEDYNNSITANFFDFNRDGLLDLYIGNVWPDHLPNYNKPTPLNLFHLPQAEYDGDERMFDFMHASWHLANNGGENVVFVQDKKGHFTKLNSKEIGMPETRWSLAIGTADLNQDGWTDLYIANDFGPDDLYFNQEGKKLYNHKGTMFGSIGKDTYKGMNASIADMNNDGFLDVYVSNVHHALQAEGSLLWFFSKDKDGNMVIQDMATQWGALNEDRFGWGASLEDFDNDGWVDIIQANGMVDDTPDKKFESCPDYWYVNEKVARSAPSYHRLANKWGDIRGRCIYGKEKNRVYINQGTSLGKKFVDVADLVGLTEETNSRGVASADFNNDGRRDVLITHMYSSPTLVRNTLKAGASTPHWVGLQLRGDGKTCNTRAVGTQVKMHYKIKGQNTVQIKEVQLATGFSAQSDERLLFGLGDSAEPVEIEITWCGLRKETRTLDIDKYHVIQMSPVTTP
ncbi:FG-GAP-like repeat-containing protein [uncultured Bdellovibrio sp.]|uniref:FG-GAP-like repeat-containing protein n=1 Tax=Bdellovibrio sp. HCB-162 TaxID=3394234 RepID=UPI0025F28FF6|nr:FG-GAP-like repeat-containing protein [uncultured Bdellovibrio sp.]